MNICIAGWYFRQDFFDAIALGRYPAFVVKHRPGDTGILESALHENRGLEFGAYRQYVENHWDWTSDVFFTHDDAAIVGDAENALSQIASLNEMGVDQAYIFPDEIHELVNGGAHGRGIWIRGEILKRLAADFPADMDNTGRNIGVVAQKGILEFHRRVLPLSANTGVIAIVPQFRYAHRGRLHDEMFVYRTTGPVPGGVVNVHQ